MNGRLSLPIAALLVIDKKGSAAPLFQKEYRAEPRRTGKFGTAADYGPSINELILSAYDKFMRDPQARAVLVAGAGPSTPSSPPAMPPPVSLRLH